MKKIILAAVAVFTFSFANAQDVKFGVKGGINFANLTGDVDASSLVGFNIGGLAEIKFSEKFAIQPELLYSAQGAKEKESVSPVSIETKVKLSYLNVPVMAKFYLTDSFSLEAGPQIGFLVGAKQKWESTSLGVTTSGDEDIKDELKTVDFGINFGAGYDFTENIFAGVRYNLGLSNINDDSNYKVKNSIFSVSVGYKF